MYKIVVILFFTVSIGFSQNNFIAKRENMVKNQIKARGIKDPSTLDAMLKVPRHKFVPSNIQNNAYQDRALRIGYGQTISQPYIVAFMTMDLQLKKEHKVLEIGTGSGYQAAILSEIVDSVFTIEIIPELGIAAKKRLKQLGYNNVNVKLDDGYYGWKEKGPFDAIIVTAASPNILEHLHTFLKPKGRMAVPVGGREQQVLTLLTKNNGHMQEEKLCQCIFVPLRGKYGFKSIH